MGYVVSVCNKLLFSGIWHRACNLKIKQFTWFWANCYYLHSWCFPSQTFCLLILFFPPVMTNWSICVSSCLSFFFQPKPLRFSDKTPRALCGACRHVLCRACWTSTTCAPGKNLQWQLWFTPSRRLLDFEQGSGGWLLGFIFR